MKRRYKYQANSTDVNIRGLTIHASKPRYANVQILEAADLAAAPAITVKTDLDLNGTFTGNLYPTDSTPPSNVTGLAGSTPTQGGTVILTWTDPVQTDLDYLEITNNVNADVVKVNAGLQTATIIGLTNGQAYIFTVKSVDGNGNKSAGVTVSKTPADAAPANPTSFNATNGAASSVLTWVDPTDSDFVSIELTWTPTGGAPAQPLTVLKGVQTTTITGLTPSTTYTFTAKSVDGTAHKSAGVTHTATPT